MSTLCAVASVTILAPAQPALPPSGDDLVKSGFLGRPQLPCSEIDALGVQPHAQAPFFLVVSLVVPGELVAGSQGVGDLGQALLSAGLVGVPLRGVGAPVQNAVQDRA
jgi:hypothetical protein